MRFEDDATLAKFQRDEGGTAAGSAWTMRRNLSYSSHKPYPSCACCYRPVPDKRATYCSRECRRAHHRLVA